MRAADAICFTVMIGEIEFTIKASLGVAAPLVDARSNGPKRGDC
jgi:hypothetical protein